MPLGLPRKRPDRSAGHRMSDKKSNGQNDEAGDDENEKAAECQPNTREHKDKSADEQRPAAEPVGKNPAHGRRYDAEAVGEKYQADGALI